MASEKRFNPRPGGMLVRLVESPIMSSIAGCMMLWTSFGVRQSLGIFLVPITKETGWDRATFSTAVALLQIFWGASQPFLAFVAERQFGFGKTLFITTLVYALGCTIMALSGSLPGLFIFATGILVGGGAGGNSFPIVLAAVGRRYPLKSKAQSVAFGISDDRSVWVEVDFDRIQYEPLSSLSFFCCHPFLRNASHRFVLTNPLHRIPAIMLLVTSPLSIFLQTIPAKPPITSSDDTAVEKKSKSLPADIETTDGAAQKRETSYDLPAPEDIVDDGTITIALYTRPEPATIQEALKEAFTSLAFWFVCLGFTVCGYHIAFLGTHLPAYLVDHGISSSIGGTKSSIYQKRIRSDIAFLRSEYLPINSLNTPPAWTISVIGFGSMCGTIFFGWLQTRIRPKYILAAIYFLRAVVMIAFLYVPLTLASTFVFAVIMGSLWLSTVPVTTALVGSIFGHRYLGTLTSITFVGHQIGAFCGAYLGGVEFDASHEYSHMWYSSFALAGFAMAASFVVDDRTMRH
ncbi:major facilitator superfamily domain-containing protein [Jimgerdemannia flammicorona]|uniref:Major facilitator superfamily domain-containing protein n=1 Tax=Jimgerdemannia flammicorona TaxID=994334 RepID=A0A433DGR1_9FUNG|nr:major facilitator superfamily domain-containing protein [Jimgerdemannia flammicorona]